MVNIEKLRWKNFLSTGNAFTEITFTEMLLVIGKNGAGKSTMLDALCFVLFNHPYRNIKKGQLVNSINSKDALCEIEFTKNGQHYLVRRGIKSAKTTTGAFDIIVDGKVMDQDGHIKDLQKHFEALIEMNYTAFKQIVILGSTNYVPFMMLKTAQRREFIEELLDLNVFSKMNTLLKDRQKENRQVITINEEKRSVLVDVIQKDEEMIEKLDNEVRQKLEQLKTELVEYTDKVSPTEKVIVETKEEIDSTEATLTSLKKTKDDLSKGVSEQVAEIKSNRSAEVEEMTAALKGQLTELDQSLLVSIKEIEENAKSEIQDITAYQDKIDKASQLKNTLQRELQEHQSVRLFYTDEKNVHCDECGQDIDPDFKGQKVQEAVSSIKTIEGKLDRIDQGLEKVKLKIKDAEEHNDGVAQTEAASIDTVKAQCDNARQAINIDIAKAEMTVKDKHQALIDRLKDKHEAELNKLSDDIREMDSTLNDLHSTCREKELWLEAVHRDIKRIEKSITECTEQLANNSYKERLDDSTKQLDQVDQILSEATLNADLYKNAGTLLKDGGIKSYIIRQYIPIINKEINRYLQKLDFFVDFYLDENFNETIKSRFYDIFSYENFSEGEKSRIDLALLFTWRSLAELKNKSNVNLLVLDEVFSGPLDSEGIILFKKVLNSINHNKVVITHNVELINEFNRVIQVTKEGDFSEYEVVQ